MCLILFSYQPASNQRLWLAANRDEFHLRPALAARSWPLQPAIIAGRDLQAGGTWLGVTKHGRFAAITNYRNPNSAEGTVSRGALCAGFLATNTSCLDYLKEIQRNRDQYSGFNLLLDDGVDFYYYSNTQNQITKLAAGYYGLSNAFLNTSWPKTMGGVEALKRAQSNDDLINLLADKTLPQDIDLPDTAIDIETERLLAPRFIQSAQYGTRASTVLSISEEILLKERGFNAAGEIIHDIEFHFTL
ncbi:MAG: hypothetical protein ACI90U_000952 [Pseudomonadales bacterium]|jgi:uncharacterized protein with NRDE domain